MSDFLDNLKEAVGENPLSAALIGGGALWLLFGNERLKSAAASVSAATARPLADIRTNLRSSAPEFANSPPTAPEMDHGTLPSGHMLSEITSAASEAPSGAANAIKDRSEKGGLPRERVSARQPKRFPQRRPSRRSNPLFPV